MSQQYFLKIAALGQYPKIEIDQARFELLKAARPVLTHALAIEEKYEIIISNYLELEREAANASVSDMVRNQMGYKDFFDVRMSLNTRLVNLLTAVRLYTDQLIGHICACFPPDENLKSELKAFFSAEYDDLFEYRFMEALRNYVQHSGIPVHTVSSGSKWTDREDALLEYYLYFASQKKVLAQDGNFKKLVLNEMPDEVNLRAAVRVYIEAISRVHKKARDKIEGIADSSRRQFDKAIRDYMVLYEKEPVGLYAYEFRGEEKINEVLILTSWDDVRLELIRRNQELINLRKRYVTSQACRK
ncbi:hypothetical protein AUR61_003685 [Stutzerimonas balearica]|uniref:hypothetical protein n=1 Tax=Stutzerimonas balearica TaxID=74829 RepID=UPI00097129C6|nr:hypothetical protein [Stutzerimonas balearica]OMG67432.1 hypothetical protein AUR61_003685 [Stutzerimonas balearica]